MFDCAILCGILPPQFVGAPCSSDVTLCVASFLCAFLRYNIFFRDWRNENKEKVEEDSGKLSFENIVQAVSQAWRASDAETREKFQALAKIDYDRYVEEMHEYRQRPDVQAGLLQPTGKRRIFRGVPKRPLSGYNLFFQEVHRG